MYIDQKLRKVVEIFHTQVTILKVEWLSLLIYIKEIEEVVSRKYKKVLGISSKTIGEVMKVIKEI
jgi:uncharacterized protein YqgV (UPF0045/DUF77 family)